ncbi:MULTISPECIES: DUF1905 domain-containing protein [Flavobacterium]|uniref:DUF1905 domain-containing protein n=1 Tax=Flavobacterium TaxID=237 RepID=UPI001E656072|nr:MULTISPECIES: DUF1905 domain-containing protein [unclassified Flavobacterium]UFH34544.1 DUF1905 domain-containing protein [Flavobacterium sp. F-29]UFH46640.1 DUF1905 domain-containing protein [Flavobacterium sp. F-340]
MNFIVENEKLEIQYIPGNGAWTYQLIIPNTKNIKGKWGDLKVSGKIDNFEIKNKNLGPMKNSDKKMALNSEIRNSIGKGAGDFVNVTLFLENQNEEKTNENEMIFECFKDAEVLSIFNKLKIDEQNEIILSINSTATENQKVEKIVKFIAKLEQLN